MEFFPPLLRRTVLCQYIHCDRNSQKYNDSLRGVGYAEPLNNNEEQVGSIVVSTIITKALKQVLNLPRPWGSVCTDMGIDHPYIRLIAVYLH